MTPGAAPIQPYPDVSLPTRVCPDDGIAWDARGRCPKCGLEQDEVNSLLRAACAEYDRAREAALRGRYAEARMCIQSARAFGLRHDALDRLASLCAAITGDWQRTSVKKLPADWQESLAQRGASPVTLTHSYKTGLEAAQASRWVEAVGATEASLEAAPWLLPTRKLNVLSLHGAGRTWDALQSCLVGLDVAPEDPDLVRWHGELAAELAAQRPPPRAANTAQKAAPGIRGLRLVGAGLAAVSLMLGFMAGRAGVHAPPPIVRTALRPVPVPPALPPVVPPTLLRPIPSASPHVVAVNPGASFPGDLQQQLARSRRRADLRQARRWLHTAARAYSSQHYGPAAHFASAAARLGQGSRLAPPARRLLARAMEHAAHITSGGNL